MYRKRRRRNQALPSGINTGQMMNLALFIMLLAFFIVLNSISSYEEIKSEKVRRSVELAFSNDKKKEEDLPSTTPDLAQGLKEGHTFDRLEALFTAQIASFEVTSSKSTGVMMVRLPYAEFDKAIMALGQKNLLDYPSRRDVRGNFFLPTLTSLLRTDIDGAPTRMEIMLHTESNPAQLQNQAPRDLNALILQAGQFSQKLEAQGVPQKLVNIGVSKGNPDFVDLVFRKYVAFSPVVEGAP